MDTSGQLSDQWRNPRDILSLLLLVGGDIVQKAIAQLFGVYVEPARGWPRMYLTPVAFSFGWVGYAVTSLASVVGDKQLMPNPDTHSIVINCDNGYGRTNRSWLLGRILRDHEINIEANPGHEVAKLRQYRTGEAQRDPPRVSLRIDIFELEGQEKPAIDHVWVLGWLTIAVQLGVSIIPWALYGDWAVFLIAGAGTVLALSTAGLRQWNQEKWPGRKLNPPSPLTSDEENRRANQEPAKTKTKIVCVTRGNGHSYAQILRGSGSAWDLETLATATTNSLPETPWCLTGLAVLWVALLITVSGLESYTWFLILIGGLGTLQNIYAASVPRKPESLGLRMRSFEERPTIIGLSMKNEVWLKDDEGDSNDEGVAPDDPLVRETPYLEPWETVGVRGAIRELEKTVPKAGIAIMPEFFPTLWRVDRERYRDSKEARFWQWMYKRPKKENRKMAAPVLPPANPPPTNSNVTSSSQENTSRT
ncbi:hypothetical protein GGR51DRAFT_573859 [Nemania sp. FL0031]|nr:hypothetical protein GGR51DRAFT_573859 [Nemania sp. FL0031]